jgi:hypothetical protein
MSEDCFGSKGPEDKVVEERWLGLGWAVLASWGRLPPDFKSTSAQAGHAGFDKELFSVAGSGERRWDRPPVSVSTPELETFGDSRI